MPFQIVHNDITRMDTDAIVNAANGQLMMGGGVCGAIFRAAGAEQLQRECQKLAPCPTGGAVITGGHGLAARYVIHAVGPVWKGGGCGERELLAGAYTSALRLARENGCGSIAFPLISAGIYGYPRREALLVAEEAIRAFLAAEDMDVYLVVFDREAVTLSEALHADILHYIDTYFDDFGERNRVAEELCYSPEPAEKLRGSGAMDEEPAEELRGSGAMDEKPSGTGRRGLGAGAPRMVPRAPKPSPGAPKPSPGASKPSPGAPEAARKFSQVNVPEFLRQRSQPLADGRLKELLERPAETFSQMLLRLIDEKGYTDVEVYKRANMDRKLFSKIRSNPGYSPGKQTVLALAVALRLSPDEAGKLLEKAGYTFSNARKQDIIIRYFLEQGQYDIYAINEALFCFDQPLLGA